MYLDVVVFFYCRRVFVKIEEEDEKDKEFRDVISSITHINFISQGDKSDSMMMVEEKEDEGIEERNERSRSQSGSSNDDHKPFILQVLRGLGFHYPENDDVDSGDDGGSGIGIGQDESTKE